METYDIILQEIYKILVLLVTDLVAVEMIGGLDRGV